MPQTRVSQEERYIYFKRLESRKTKRQTQINFDNEEFYAHAKPNLYEEAYQRIRYFVIPDITIMIGEEEFECHLAVLKLYSELFMREYKLQQNCQYTYLEIPDSIVTVDAFINIYDWMICPETECNLRRDDIIDIYVASKYLEIPDLVKQCRTVLESKYIFNEDSAFKLYLQAKSRDVPEVTEMMLARIKSYFLKLVSTDQFVELDCDDICALFQSNDILINNEVEVFYAALRWLRHDMFWHERRQYIVKIMNSIRFGLMSSLHLINIKRNQLHTDIRDILKQPGIPRMLDKALIYSIAKHFEKFRPGVDRTATDKYILSHMPEPRNFTGRSKNYDDYYEFMDYISTIKYDPKKHIFYDPSCVQEENVTSSNDAVNETTYNYESDDDTNVTASDNESSEFDDDDTIDISPEFEATIIITNNKVDVGIQVDMSEEETNIGSESEARVNCQEKDDYDPKKL